jgi:hypothetical protein
MRLGELRSGKTLIALCSIALSTLLPATPALSQTAAKSGPEAQLQLREGFHLAQYRECSQRAGPYATQTTAWQRWREAGSRGYSVSNGVVPCYDETSTRGYCFFVFFRC